LLIYPNPESALNEEAGKLLLEDYDTYFKHAKLMASIHATKNNHIFMKAATGVLMPTQDKEKGNISPKKRNIIVDDQKPKKVAKDKKGMRRL
jgi:ubiquitin-conjugating enzyme E2 S